METDNDKLLTLFYLKDFAQNYGIPFAKIGQALPKKNENDPEANAAYEAYMATMNTIFKQGCTVF